VLYLCCNHGDDIALCTACKTLFVIIHSGRHRCVRPLDNLEQKELSSFPLVFQDPVRF
jgi:hypothetical protein